MWSDLRRRSIRRRATSVLPLLALSVVGTACLAANVVPVTYAGTTTVSVAAPTMLTPTTSAKINVAQEDAHTYYHFINVSAVLTTGGVPLVDQSVTFTTNGGNICVATTDADGEADCPSDTKVDTDEFVGDTPATFTATFVGHDGLATATATGALRPVGSP